MLLDGAISVKQLVDGLNDFMEEPEAEQLEIGKLYTLEDILPIYLNAKDENGKLKPSNFPRVCIEEIPVHDRRFFEANGIDNPDFQSQYNTGFHHTLFEELTEVDIETRIRRRNEFVQEIAAGKDDT